MSLREYQGKRDFRKTTEPKGSAQPRATGGRKTRPPHNRRASAKPRFVVHKHDASRLHYDLRLEMEGVLKSWAVPKGPSLNPSDKRLAVMVEDHPLQYADFEGVIPEGEYGGGTVMIWDEGTYEVQGDDKAPDAVANGELKVVLRGKKLKSGWVLVRTKWRGEDRNWLLIKEKDEQARSRHTAGGQARGDILEQEPDSARSGRSIAEIAADG
jgi:bifunctional non-homologous end joining protein LigD